MKSLMIATVLVFSASLLSLIGYMQPAQAQPFPCDLPNPPEWCFQTYVPLRQFPWECRCPEVEIPRDLGINERIIIETIPGQFSDTLVISKVFANASAVSMPTNTTDTPIG
jgi:hypothetical protein